MRKRAFIGLASAVVVLLAMVSNSGDSQKPSTFTTASSSTTQSETVDSQPAPKAKPTCDGTAVTNNCTVDGVAYSTYVYHPAVAEKSHLKTVTTYQKQVTGYCTLCNDGAYSPSCATGRGACSWHGGVQEWNAPRYSTVPVDTTETVVDAAAQEAYYEKIPQ